MSDLTPLQKLERDCIMAPGRANVMRLTSALRRYRLAVAAALKCQTSDGAIGPDVLRDLSSEVHDIEQAKDGAPA